MTKSLLLLAAYVLMLLVPGPTRAGVPGEPVYAGIWTARAGEGPSALYVDMDWENLVARWKSLPGEGLRLADVDVYRKDGKTRFAALWHRAPGNGALFFAPWEDFVKLWKELRPTQELVDLEVFEDRGKRLFLGVWQVKSTPSPASGALFADMTWEGLAAQHRALGDNQYLSDVATYTVGGKRLFAGVWRIGKGNGALYWQTNWSDFVARKRSLDATQELQDLNLFQDADGRWNAIGVWRAAEPQKLPLDASRSEARFEPLTSAQLIDHWKSRKAPLVMSGLAVAPSFTALRGDAACTWGDRDCNRCARRVEEQFQQAFRSSGGPSIDWKQRQWRFRGNDAYPPDGLQPEDAFKPFGDGLAAGVVVKHVQGLVRTNSKRFPYAGSHSHKDKGSLFVVENRSGELGLHALYRSASSHPSGVAVLGDGLFVSEGGQLRVVRISESGQAQDVVSPLKGLGSAGGGLGLARLHDGKTLLVVSGAGAGFRKGITRNQREENLEPRQTRFFLLDDPFSKLPANLEAIGEWKHPVESRPDKPMGYSENLSVVTDCDSGRLYTVHTTGDYGLKGNGFWRLSRIDDGPKLTHVAIARQDQHNERCHHRSSATVHVDPDGMLRFVCTERAVIKWHPKGEFTLTEGAR